MKLTDVQRALLISLRDENVGSVSKEEVTALSKLGLVTVSERVYVDGGVATRNLVVEITDLGRSALSPTSNEKE